MSVTSVEALEALPVGTVIEVKGRRPYTWTRTERGWESDGALLKSEFFVGHVTAGQVRDQTSSEPATGQWWYDGSTHYLLLEVVGGARYLPCLVFHVDTSVDVQIGTLRRTYMRNYNRSTPEQVRQVATPERMVDVVHLLVAARAELVEARSERDQRTQEVHSLKNRPDPAELQPQVIQVGEALARAAEAVRTISNALGTGQTGV